MRRFKIVNTNNGQAPSTISNAIIMSGYNRIDLIKEADNQPYESIKIPVSYYGYQFTLEVFKK